MICYIETYKSAVHTVLWYLLAQSQTWLLSDALTVCEHQIPVYPFNLALTCL